MRCFDSRDLFHTDLHDVFDNAVMRGAPPFNLWHCYGSKSSSSFIEIFLTDLNCQVRSKLIPVRFKHGHGTLTVNDSILSSKWKLDGAVACILFIFDSSLPKVRGKTSMVSVSQAKGHMPRQLDIPQLRSCLHGRIHPRDAINWGRSQQQWLPWCSCPVWYLKRSYVYINHSKSAACCPIAIAYYPFPPPPRCPEWFTSFRKLRLIWRVQNHQLPPVIRLNGMNVVFCKLDRYGDVVTSIAEYLHEVVLLELVHRRMDYNIFLTS